MIFPQEHTDIMYILQDVLALLTISYQALPSHSRSFSARSSIHCHQQCQGKKPRYSSQHGCDVARPRAKMIQSRNLLTSKSRPSVLIPILVQHREKRKIQPPHSNHLACERPEWLSPPPATTEGFISFGGPGYKPPSIFAIHSPTYHT